MRRLPLLCLALLLSGCVASLAEIRQAPPDQVGNFSAPAPTLSYCVLRGIEAIDSPYEAHLSGGGRSTGIFYHRHATIAPGSTDSGV